MTDLLDTLAKPPPPPSELDILMSKPPLDCIPSDIDAIIAYQRQNRARKAEGGGRSRKAQVDTGPKQVLDLAALGLVGKPATQAVVKPSSGGFRRI